jgi:RNA polymerase sigma-70 factor (ECF subfamily)
LLSLLTVITETERYKVNVLITAIAAGHEASLTELYELVGGRLLSVAVGLIRERALAEDVLQDSLIKIVKNAHMFRAGTNGYAWLCRIVRNTALNKIKSENLRRADSIDNLFDLADEGSLYNDSDTAREVRDAMRALYKKEKLAIWLKYYNEMTVREIAAELHVAKSTAQDLITRAEEKLRKMLIDRT